MNRLAHEKSLYLRQHADNPVDWYPWGPEALARAVAEDKPLLVSIGYSACHWCHVMAHESFEDPYTARLMNQHFVCVKVDREERPDIDQIYMEAVQMMNGHGGWPLNMFCLPDGRPFAGGTYFPPTDTGRGLVPWPQLLMRVADYYTRQRGDLEDNAGAIVSNMLASNEPPTGEAATLTPTAILDAARKLCTEHDDGYGGFGGAPKFPPSMAVCFLLAIRNARAVDEADPQFAARIESVVDNTLTGMARGGIYDQVGGGFARYSVDRYWIIPHFEKMLYDNGQLLEAYTAGWLSRRNPLYKRIVEETADWLLRRMRAPEGTFFSSYDADSEGEEGKFYVWTPAQVREALGEADAEKFCQAYGITDGGNFEHGASNPTLRINAIEARDALRPLRERLLAIREQRVPPGLDTKRLVSWNALAIRGLVTAGFYLDRPDWFRAAMQAADWIWDHMRRDADRLHSVAYDGGDVRHNGTLDDHAFLAEALLALASKADWLEPGLSARYLDRARALADTVLRHFADPDGPGFHFTSDDHESLPCRRKEWFDNALPAGNSAMAHVLSTLHALGGEPLHAQVLDALRGAYTGLAERAPRAAAHALEAFAHEAVGLCVIKARAIPLAPLCSALRARAWRPIFLMSTDDPAQPTGYQLCAGTQCLQPGTDPEAIAGIIAGAVLDA